MHFGTIFEKKNHFNHFILAEENIKVDERSSWCISVLSHMIHLLGHHDKIHLRCSGRLCGLIILSV